MKKFFLNTEFNSTNTNQKIAGYKNTLNVWNAGATCLFLKADRAQLKLSVNDILQSNVGRTTGITANSIRDVQTNNLGRYFLMTLNYNIQSFGAKKT